MLSPQKDEVHHRGLPRSSDTRLPSTSSNAVTTSMTSWSNNITDDFVVLAFNIFKEFDDIDDELVEQDD